MKIKKFIAESMPEAMAEIKRTLGQDAVIWSSKEIKTGGFLGLFQKKKIEVIAALDEEVKGPSVERKLQQEMVAPKPWKEERMTSATYDVVLKEMKQMKQLLQMQSSKAASFPLPYQSFYDYLLEQELEDSIVKEMLKELLAEYEDDPITSDQLRYALERKLVEKLAHVSFEGIQSDKQIIQFVGPTGVGKTTTLAKIAALTMLEQLKSIAFITTDTYRIAAIEQLKTYAKILDVEVAVAYNATDYQHALTEFAHYDHIFVDTAGRNYRDDRYIQALEQMIDVRDEQVETYLVLSLTAKNRDVLDIYEQFIPLHINKLILTKLDETLTYGTIFNLLMMHPLDIAYLTNGQDVPDDILKPTKENISKLILSRYSDE